VPDSYRDTSFKTSININEYDCLTYMFFPPIVSIVFNLALIHHRLAVSNMFKCIKTKIN